MPSPKAPCIAESPFSELDRGERARGAVRGSRLRSNQAYYRIFDFLTWHCPAFSGHLDRALINGRLKLQGDL